MNEDGMWNHADCDDIEIRHGYVCQMDANRSSSSLEDVQNMLIQLIQMSEIMRQDQETSRLALISLEKSYSQTTELLDTVVKSSESCTRLVIVSLLLLFLISAVMLFTILCLCGCSCRCADYPGTRLPKLQLSFASAPHDEEDDLV
jgi:hypothetical protein